MNSATAFKIKSNASKTFKMHGLSLRSEACKYLVNLFLPIDESAHEEWLQKIIEHLQRQTLSTSAVEKSNIELAIQECSRSELDDSESIVNVISAFEVPRFIYNPERKKYVEDKAVKTFPPCLFDVPKSKADLFKNRYILLKQRTERHDLFTPAVIGCESDEAGRKFQLQPVEYLLSSSSRLGEAIVLGLLTQLKEGCYFLEDPTGIVQLDLANTKFHTGLHTENCFVLAEGWYEDKIFHVNAMGFPPAETAKTTRAYFGNLNFFGGPSAVSVKSSPKLLRLEKENEDGMIVFIADVWLDRIKVLEKLRILFHGYAECPPIAFVFMGNFLSSQQGSDHTHMLKAQMKVLGDLIAEFPSLVQSSRFIFVPGPSDPTFANILPRPPIAKSIREDLEKKVPSAIFATNPCRIQYCTQEIVVFREDIVTKMCRNTIYFPVSGEIHDHFAKTIVCQAHLAPLPLSVCPVYWSFDMGLHLYPVPDLVVCADQLNAFSTSYMDCQVINPGSFPKSDFSFKVYIPSSQQVEDSQIPNE